MVCIQLAWNDLSIVHLRPEAQPPAVNSEKDDQRKREKLGGRAIVATLDQH